MFKRRKEEQGEWYDSSPAKGGDLLALIMKDLVETWGLMVYELLFSMTLIVCLFHVLETILG